VGANRAGLNEHEAPSKIVTARPVKRLAQLCSVSHALVSTLQKHWSISENWYDMPPYTSETTGGEHVRRFACG